MKNKNLIMVGLVALVIVGIWLYFQFSTSIFPPHPLERERSAILYGTPEQKEQALDDFIFRVEKFNVGTIPLEERTDINTITPLVPVVIEAILDDTPLPRHEDTGWGYVYHQAASAMNMFAYRVDRVQRNQDPEFSFFSIGGIANEVERKVAHDNWLNWWNENKDNIAIIS
jgi:hypothetical protein